MTDNDGAPNGHQGYGGPAALADPEPARRRLSARERVGLGLTVLSLIMLALFILEGSVGHDGLLCELGIDTGPTSDSCAPRLLGG